MRVILSILLIVFLIFGCKPKPNSEEIKQNKIAIKTSDIKVNSYNYDELKPLLHKEDNKTYVINFWATWCAPCVKELPAFEKLNSNYTDKNVEVLLVSLDFPKQVEKKLIPFIQKKNLQSKVVLLNDDDEQRWINDISTEWSGALPATLIYNRNNRKFYEQSFDYKELETELQTFLN